MGQRFGDLGIEIKILKKLLNENKTKILEMLQKKEQMTISEIQRGLGISYKETYRHIKELVNAGLLTREHHKTKEKHQPVYISIRKDEALNNTKTDNRRN